MKIVKMIYKIIMILLLTTYSIYGQIKLSGIVLDSLTHQPIPDLSIIELSKNRGTITNENGEFEISVSSFPCQLLFSHVSYSKTIRIAESNNLGEIYLSLATINLEEVKSENPAITLLNSAIRKALSDSASYYPCRAFYQKVSKEGNLYTNIHEIFFDGMWNQFGFKKWLPTNSRYAIKDNSKFKYQNFTTRVFYNSGVLSFNIFSPNSPRNDRSIFQLKIGKYLNIGTSDEIVEIICTPKHKQEGHFEGMIYVKTSNTNIVKIVGEIHYANDPKVKKIKNPYDSFIINYRENKNGFSVLDNLNFTKVLTFSGGVDKQITESAKLIVYEYNNEIKTESMENAMIKSDIDLIKKKPYDELFWKSHEVIKRSNLEKSLIKSFENGRSFESNFIIEK